MSMEKAFQIEETASTRTMKEEFPGVFKCVPVWLEQSGMGMGA